MVSVSVAILQASAVPRTATALNGRRGVVVSAVDERWAVLLEDAAEPKAVPKEKLQMVKLGEEAVRLVKHLVKQNMVFLLNYGERWMVKHRL